MLDISPVPAAVPVIKPVKIKRDDPRFSNQPRRKKTNPPEQQDSQPAQHIDVSV